MDESGDRNFGANRQSDYFSMTAVLVAAEHRDDLQVALAGLNKVLGVADTLHWKVHCRSRDPKRRDLVARTLARVPGVRVIHVVLDKTRTRPEARMRDRQQVTYGFATKFVAEGVATAAENWEGGPRAAIVSLGVVGGVDHDQVAQALEYIMRASYRKSAHANVRAIEWNSLIWPPTWSEADQRDGLQAADAYSGMLAAAVKEDRPEWLISTGHQLFHRAGEIYGYGIKLLPTGTNYLAHRPWWPRLAEAARAQA